MQATNQQNLQTIYEKGDQNVEQMQQLEDLARIIRDKDDQLKAANDQINDLKNQCRDLHNEIVEIKKEAAEVAQVKGEHMLISSQMADKMMADPRYRRLVDKQKKADTQEGIQKLKI